jgi:hypothetical protein
MLSVVYVITGTGYRPPPPHPQCCPMKLFARRQHWKIGRREGEINVSKNGIIHPNVSKNQIVPMCIVKDFLHTLFGLNQWEYFYLYISIKTLYDAPSDR